MRKSGDNGNGKLKLYLIHRSQPNILTQQLHFSKYIIFSCTLSYLATENLCLTYLVQSENEHHETQQKYENCKKKLVFHSSDFARSLPDKKLF